MIQKIRADAQAQATAANGFQGDPLQPLGRYFGYLASADRDHRPDAAGAGPAAASASASGRSRPRRAAPTCTIKRIVRRHRHVVIRRTRAGKRYRTRAHPQARAQAAHLPLNASL